MDYIHDIANTKQSVTVVGFDHTCDCTSAQNVRIWLCNHYHMSLEL